MATTVTPAQLSERGDIHKSCKSLETLVNVLNDYSEAAIAIASLQKKLAKALRETAGLKVTGEIAANAFSASANIFEALSDVDNKFAKVTDKECESISTEVRKWFKKLAKEEKAHDDRLSNANARIKQAGQVYEKKSKKSAHDAAEEHARYINLLSSLGPEMSQDKYNHAVFVSQRHTSTTYCVAAGVSRVADSEWLRSCEEVRRFSPSVGQLGEWRALCEGGWTGPVPQGLPDFDQASSQPSSSQTGSDRPLDPRDSRNSQAVDNREQYPTGLVSNGSEQGHGQSPNRTQPYLQSHNRPSSQDALQPPRAPFNDDRMNSLASITSLTAFPSPPTHFPIPPAFTTSDEQRPQQPPSYPSSTAQSRPPPSSVVNVPSPALARVTESPTPLEDEQRSANVSGTDDPRSLHPGLEDVTAASAQPEKIQESFEPVNEQGMFRTGNTTQTNFPQRPQSPQRQASLKAGADSAPLEKAPSGSSSASITQGRGDYLPDDHEFGVRDRSEAQLKSRSVDALKSKDPQRSNSSASSGSVVAAMRSRYAPQSPKPSSPPPRDLPRLPLSVTNLATRYQPAEDPGSTRPRAASPQVERQRSISNATPYRATPPSPMYGHQSRSSVDADVQRRRERIGELSQLEMKEKELELRAREREIETRSRELQRDRAELANVRGGDVFTSDASRGVARQNQKRPMSQLDYSSPTNVQAQYSYSTTHLVPPSSKAHSQASSGTPSYDSRSQPSSPVPPVGAEHAPFCGCDSCSVSKYRASPTVTPHDLRPPGPPISLRPEKQKTGWMRRLSMPVVGNAFSKGGVSPLRDFPSPQEDGRIRRLGAGISNGSMTNLGRR